MRYPPWQGPGIRTLTGYQEALVSAGHGAILLALLGFIGVSFPAHAQASDTTWFGGTTWDPVDTRWEAIRDSVWTFDSGVGSSFNHGLPWVDPNKDPSIHAMMEGWIGLDVQRGPKGSRWRLVDAADPRWDPAGCMTDLDGTAAWLGLFAAEADSACYLNSQGNGNFWSWMLSKDFFHTTGEVTISFDYDNDASSTLRSRADHIPGSIRPFTSAPANGSGTITWTWTPPENTLIRIQIYFESGLDTDQDGGFDSSCGVAVDNIELSGAIVDFTDFETGWNGWVQGPAQLGAVPDNGDWSQLAHISYLESLATGPCGVADSVLCFAKLNDPSWSHSDNQWNLAISPWIDLTQEGFTGDQIEAVSLDFYFDTIYHNYLYGRVDLQWYPDTAHGPGSTCERFIQDWYPEGYLGYYGAQCTPPGTPLMIDVAGVVPAEATRVRVAVGAWSLNYLYGYYDSTKSNPWIDNVRLGVVTGPPLSAPLPAPTARIHAFPNPVRPGATVNLSVGEGSRPTTVRVFDIAGRHVAQWRLDGQQAHLAVGAGGRPLAAGLYHLRWETDNGPRSTKLLVLQD